MPSGLKGLLGMADHGFDVLRDPGGEGAAAAFVGRDDEGGELIEGGAFFCREEDGRGGRDLEGEIVMVLLGRSNGFSPERGGEGGKIAA